MYYATYHCSLNETSSNYVFTGTCLECKKEINVSVPKSELNSYKKDVLIQNAMPSVSECNREFLISGVCGACFDKITERES